ncbi:MAG: hypothetical protein GWN62_21275, partial [Aliifodinibius sp.]|nr:hypothetical protein [Fodinibius sp.]
TGLFVFSASDETHPVGLDIAVITVPEDDFFGPMYLAFESNIGGESHIYTHDFPGDYQNCYDISQNTGSDQNPIFSSEAWAEAMS